LANAIAERSEAIRVSERSERTGRLSPLANAIAERSEAIA
jgi:hypothetical protein